MRGHLYSYGSLNSYSRMGHLTSCSPDSPPHTHGFNSGERVCNMRVTRLSECSLYKDKLERDES